MELLEKIGSQVPALAVLVIQSAMFLKAQRDDREGFLRSLKEIRDSNATERREMFDRLNMLHAEHLSARADSRIVLAQVANALNDFTIAMNSKP